MPAELTPADIARWRLRTQGLVGSRFASPIDVVSTLGAVQSQDHTIARWSVAQRAVNTTVADVQGLLDAGELLRTHVLRPTWHYVTPADIRWLLAVTSHRVHVQNGTYYRRHGFDDDTFDRAHTAIRAALHGGTHLTRAELSDRLTMAGVDVASGQPLEHLVMHAELDGVVCSGPMRGRQQTYALLDDRVPQPRVLDADAALVELIVRYFTGHGPATAKDLGWWSSLTMCQINAGLDQLGDRLHHHTVDGRTYFVTDRVPDDLSPADPPDVHLVQSLDEYIVGYRDSRDVTDLSGIEAANRDTLGLPSALVLVDGQVVGRWRRKIRAAHVDVDVVCHRRLSDPEQAGLHAEADRHAAALERTATVRTATR